VKDKPIQLISKEEIWKFEKI